MKLEQSAIVLSDVRLYARHGVMEQERRVGAWFSVSLRVHYNIQEATETDSLESTISYADVRDVVKAEMAVPSKLLEHVAARVGRAVMERFPQVEAVEVKLLKLNPPMGADCGGAGVELHLINDKTGSRL